MKKKLMMFSLIILFIALVGCKQTSKKGTSETSRSSDHTSVIEKNEDTAIPDLIGSWEMYMENSEEPLLKMTFKTDGTLEQITSGATEGEVGKYKIEKKDGKDTIFIGKKDEKEVNPKFIVKEEGTNYKLLVYGNEAKKFELKKTD